MLQASTLQLRELHLWTGLLEQGGPCCVGQNNTEEGTIGWEELPATLRVADHENASILMTSRAYQRVIDSSRTEAPIGAADLLQLVKSNTRQAALSGRSDSDYISHVRNLGISDPEAHVRLFTTKSRLTPGIFFTAISRPTLQKQREFRSTREETPFAKYNSHQNQSPLEVLLPHHHQHYPLSSAPLHHTRHTSHLRLIVVRGAKNTLSDEVDPSRCKSS